MQEPEIRLAPRSSSRRLLAVLWRALAALILSLFFTRFAAAGPVDGTVHTANDLTSRLVTLIREAPLGDARIGVFAQAVDSGEILVDIGADQMLTPASNFKLFTTAAGLLLLEPEFTWNTDIAATGPVEDGVLQGSLVIVGRGDPTFGGRFNPSDSTDLTWQFSDWAAQLKALGITRIEGDVVGDDDYFDDVLFGHAWYPDERAEWYCAEVSALSFNDGCIDILWKGGKKPNASPTYALNPPTQYCEIVNQVRTIPKGGSDWDVTYFRDENSNQITARGAIPVNEKKYDYAAIHNPTLFTATIVMETLQKEGIAVSGAARDIDDIPDKEALQQNRTVLFTHRSPKVSSIVEVINRKSQNLYAELLLRTLGKMFGEEGSFAGGCQVVENFLRDRDIFRSGYCCVDGSGLSYLNKTSARMLVDLLRFMFWTQHYQTYLDSLPQGGERGSLKSRFDNSDDAKRVASRIFAKTGWIGGVHSLSGYIHGAPDIAFSILLNDYECPDSTARDLVDSLAVAIAQSNEKNP